MCGIVGIISKKIGGLFHSDLEMFEALLVNDTQRGLDSTGAFSVLRRGEVQTVKVGSHPLHLFQCKEWTEFRRDAIATGSIIIGHNRSATRGSINSANAHPFNEDGIILVHNGTLRGDHKKLGDREVDSHALCHAFATRGHEEVLPEVDGAFALVWWDVKRGSLFAIRNSERPLTMTTTKDTIIIASEAWMAKGQCERSNTPVLSSISLPEDVLYEFKPGGEFTTKKLVLKDDSSKWTGYTSGVSRHWPGVVDDLDRPDTGLDQIRPPINTTESVVLPFQLKHFGKDDTIAVKLTQATTENSGRIRVVGYTLMPGKPRTDVIGFLDKDVKPASMAAWLNGPVKAKILSTHSTSCGPSIFLKDIEMDTQIETYPNRIIGQTVWKEISKRCQCTSCKGFIGPNENTVTSVNLVKEEPKIFCADCIETQLEGKVKDAFIEARSLTVQNAVGQRKESGISLIPLANAPSSQSLQ